MLGSHTTKAWPATQASLAVSSGEPAYYGIVRATGIGLGLRALLSDGRVLALEGLDRYRGSNGHRRLSRAGQAEAP